MPTNDQITVLPVVSGAAHSTELALFAQAEDYLRDAHAASTLRAYRADWLDFCGWCDAHNRVSLPATSETVVLYITDRASNHKVATLNRRLTAISQAHQARSHESPTKSLPVRTVMRGIRRNLGVAQPTKTPALTEDIRAMVKTLPPNLLGVRDRALLLLGFAGAFRRSELVALDVADIKFASEGLLVTVRRSKTDQEGAGQHVGVAYGSDPATCPVRALRVWLERSELSEGPIFRYIDRYENIGPRRLSAEGVAIAVKRAVERIGKNPAEYAGHSLRSGMATSAAKAGVPERAIAKQTRHKSLEVLRRYIQMGEVWTENASTRLGL